MHGTTVQHQSLPVTSQSAALLQSGGPAFTGTESNGLGKGRDGASLCFRASIALGCIMLPLKKYNQDDYVVTWKNALI